MSELDGLQRDIGEAIVQSLGVARAATQAAAAQVKRKAQENISGHAHLPAYPASITYETHLTPWGAEAEIGPDKTRAQGPLGNVIEYGTIKNAPLPHLGPALDSEGAGFEQGVSAAVERLL